MKTKISLNMIPVDGILYEGYLWMSDEIEPQLYFNDRPLILPAEYENPFIIEGNLWNERDKLSYLIRFSDGSYFVYKFDFKEVDEERITRLEYLPHRMDEVSKLVFNEIWTEQPDSFCEGFNVLKPSFVAFVGFIK